MIMVFCAVRPRLALLRRHHRDELGREGGQAVLLPQPLQAGLRHRLRRRALELPLDRIAQEPEASAHRQDHRQHDHEGNAEQLEAAPAALLHAVVFQTPSSSMTSPRSRKSIRCASTDRPAAPLSLGSSPAYMRSTMAGTAPTSALSRRSICPLALLAVPDQPTDETVRLVDQLAMRRK